ncbi:MAG: hypothetical protein LBQ09_02445 [Acidobacteriaceae bacterium]|jgi:hypothetical protein|nr:hypothetical protein [Acidobacteriaceae bacterium]
MQQRQLRLGDTLDDYCPRERRVTNHVVVAMIGNDVRQTRCATCDAEHEFKHARVPRPRRKTDIIGIHPGAAMVRRAVAPPLVESVEHETLPDVLPDVLSEVPDEAHDLSGRDLLAADIPESDLSPSDIATSELAASMHVPMSVVGARASEQAGDSEEGESPRVEEGPVHRRLIRAQLPRIEGQPSGSSPRQTPDFTIRQPDDRANRFSTRQQRNAFFANRSSQGTQGNSYGQSRDTRDSRGGQRPPNGRSGGPDRHGHRHKRSR